MILKQTLLTVSALSMLTMTAGAADMPVKAPVPLPVVQQATGYVEVYGGWASTRIRDTFCEVGVDCVSDSERFRGWLLGGAGRGNYWIGPNMSVQLDAQAEGTSYKAGLRRVASRTNFSNHSYLIGGHINWRDLQRGLLGIFAGAGDAGGGFSEAKRHVVVGGEGQLYWNQFTLYVQGGYDTIVGDSFSGEPHAWFVRGTGRYFLMPNTCSRARFCTPMAKLIITLSSFRRAHRPRKASRLGCGKPSSNIASRRRPLRSS